MIVEFIKGRLFDIDNTYPEIDSEFNRDETVAVTNNKSNIFMHKSSQHFGYFVEVHTPKYGMLAIFREKAHHD